ncbi:AKT-interacting protein isoform X2 [Bemisia tabaci]|uniref:AKT-interacting protein isoform X2 n=1 Tax=Bemisia tabaci TaxID=7038 RepID=UPI0008F9A70B|nr:PREDICTED: AKT-interacting protein isoform X2 [Bemisia tabaci]
MAGTSKESGEPELKRQGSLRRVVPSLPGSESMLKLLSRSHISQPNNVQLKPFNSFFLEYSIISEFNIVARHKIPGLYTAPSAASPLEWYAVLFIRSGPYEGAIFRFTMLIPETFPDSTTPKVIFQSDTFHPQIDKDSGELNIREKFPEWRKDLNHLWQVLDYTQSIFYNIETKNAVNLESTNLFETDLETWKLRISACVDVSKAKIFDPPPVDDSNCLKFSPYSEEVHGTTKKTISAGLVRLRTT